MMQRNRKNVLAALGGVAFLAMPIAANAQALGARVGSLGIGSSASNGVVSLGGLNAGLTGLTSGLTSGPSLVSTSLAPITTTGLVTSNTGTITANVLGGGSVLSAGLTPISANVGNGLVTLGTPGTNATVLGNGNVATISTGGPLNATVGGLDPNNPVVPVSAPPTTLGPDTFFSSTSLRMNGGSGGGSGGGGPQSSESASAESSTQVCERVLRRPGSFSRAAVSQCRRVVASLAVRRR